MVSRGRLVNAAGGGDGVRGLLDGGSTPTYCPRAAGREIPLPDGPLAPVGAGTIPRPRVAWLRGSDTRLRTPVPRPR